MRKLSRLEISDLGSIGSRGIAQLIRVSAPAYAESWPSHDEAHYII